MNNSYRTGQRKNILDYLKENENSFFSAEEILSHLKRKKQDVGLTTIYRYLKILEENNNVRIEVKNNTKYYQYIAEDCNTHLFLKCKSCGQSMDLDCKEFEHINKHIKAEHNFSLDNNTIFYGTCEKCEANEVE